MAVKQKASAGVVAGTGYVSVAQMPRESRPPCYIRAKTTRLRVPKIFDPSAQSDIVIETALYRSVKLVFNDGHTEISLYSGKVVYKLVFFLYSCFKKILLTSILPSIRISHSSASRGR